MEFILMEDMRYRSSIFPNKWPTGHPKSFSNPTFSHRFEMSSLCNALNHSMFLGLFLIFIFNYNDLLWANSITAFSQSIYSYLKPEHFAFGDVQEHREMTGNF